MNEHIENDNNKPSESPEIKPHQNIKEFEADKKDSLLSLFAFVLGFLFSRWVLFSWQGWGVSVFTFCYCISIVLYLKYKGVRIKKEGWFWLVIVLMIGANYALYSNYGLEPWRSFFLLCSGVYLVIYSTGQNISGTTSNWILLDGINGLFVIPFRNFGCQYKSLAVLAPGKKTNRKQILSIFVGLILTFFVFVLVLPLLMQADSGGFYKLTSKILGFFQMPDEAIVIILQGILAIPIAAYLFGLISGCAHKRGCGTFNIEQMQKNISSLRILPKESAYTLLAFVSGLYIVFISSQIPYYFSAFTGHRPEGWQVYSEYARRGFFELCQIAAINLIILTAANYFCKTPRQGSKALKIFNCLLALLTLLLIATALSKMALYISVYGLSIRRLLPCMFMIFLIIVCIGIIAMQKWQFSIMRLTAGVGVVLLCVLCYLNPDALVTQYNTKRYISGSLENFDVGILRQAGPAGVDSAIELLSVTKDEALKIELNEYLFEVHYLAVSKRGTARNNLEIINGDRKISNLIIQE